MRGGRGIFGWKKAPAASLRFLPWPWTCDRALARTPLHGADRYVRAKLFWPLPLLWDVPSSHFAVMAAKKTFVIEPTSTGTTCERMLADNSATG